MSVLTSQSNLKTNAINAFAKAGDLQKRILFTLFALIVFRFGTYIPLPGISSEVLKEVFKPGENGLLGMFDTFAGGALSRMTILALNIMPYITASIIIQMAAPIVPALNALKKEGAAGYRKMNQYMRYLTIVVAVFQALGLSVFLENMTGPSGAPVVIMDSSFLFRLTTIISLLGGTLFVVWLGEQITSRGIGNGTSLIIAVGIIAGLPSAVAQTLDFGKTHQLTVLLIALLAFVIIWIIVAVERAQRRIVIQYPKGMMGGRPLSAKNTYFPMKVNPAGVMPPIFASALIAVVLTLVKFFGSDSSFGQDLQNTFNRGTALYLFIYAGLIILFTFVYTSLSFNLTEKAEDLKRSGAFIAGIRPGKSTALYLDYVMTRLLTIGAIYLTALCVLPQILISELSVPLYLGGTSLLIVVTVIMDTMTQIQSHLVAYQYENLIKKAQLKGRF